MQIHLDTLGLHGDFQVRLQTQDELTQFELLQIPSDAILTRKTNALGLYFVTDMQLNVLSQNEDLLYCLTTTAVKIWETASIQEIPAKLLIYSHIDKILAIDSFTDTTLKVCDDLGMVSFVDRGNLEF